MHTEQLSHCEARKGGGEEDTEEVEAGNWPGICMRDNWLQLFHRHCQFSQKVVGKVVSKIPGGIQEWAGSETFNRKTLLGTRKRSSFSTVSQVIFIPGLASLRQAALNLMTSNKCIIILSIYWLHTMLLFYGFTYIALHIFDNNPMRKVLFIL